MSPEKFQNNESNFDQFAKETLVASELAVKAAVDREFIARGDKEIEYPSTTGVITDTGELNNSTFAGFIAHAQRDYGPKAKGGIAVEFGESLRDNGIIPGVAIIPKNISEALITTPDFTKKAVSSLEVLSLTRELAVTFDVSGTSEPYDNKNPFATEEVIKLTNIKDEQGKDTGIQVVILMGASSDFSSSIIADDAQVSQEIAEADIADNALVSSPIIIPRSPSIVASIHDTSGMPLSSEDPLLSSKVSLGLKIATRTLEVIGEEFSGESVVMTLSDRTAEEMIGLKEETHPDFQWLRDLT